MVCVGVYKMGPNWIVCRCSPQQTSPNSTYEADLTTCPCHCYDTQPVIRVASLPTLLQLCRFIVCNKTTANLILMLGYHVNIFAVLCKRQTWQCSKRAGTAYVGIPYRNFFLFLNFVPALINIYYYYALSLFFHFFWPYILLSLLRSIPAFLNFHFEHCLLENIVLSTTR
jgi:hypothetical protein